MISVDGMEYANLTLYRVEHLGNALTFCHYLHEERPSLRYKDRLVTNVRETTVLYSAYRNNSINQLQTKCLVIYHYASHNTVLKRLRH
jgi:hypothetical protein